MNLNASIQRTEPGFHCDLCGQPLPREGAVSLGYDYQGRSTSFQACPTCLTARTLLPELFGKGQDPAAPRR